MAGCPISVCCLFAGLFAMACCSRLGHSRTHLRILAVLSLHELISDGLDLGFDNSSTNSSTSHDGEERSPPGYDAANDSDEMSGLPSKNSLESSTVTTMWSKMELVKGGECITSTDREGQGQHDSFSATTTDVTRIQSTLDINGNNNTDHGSLVTSGSNPENVKMGSGSIEAYSVTPASKRPARPPSEIYKQLLESRSLFANVYQLRHRSCKNRCGESNICSCKTICLHLNTCCVDFHEACGEVFDLEKSAARFGWLSDVDTLCMDNLVVVNSCSTTRCRGSHCRFWSSSVAAEEYKASLPQLRDHLYNLLADKVTWGNNSNNTNENQDLTLIDVLLMMLSVAVTDEIAVQEEQPEDKRADKRLDPVSAMFISTPLLDSSTGISYRNISTYVCNEASLGHAKLWHVNVPKSPRDVIVGSDIDSGRDIFSLINFAEANISDVIYTKSLGDDMERCNDHAVAACPVTFSDVKVREACETSSFHVTLVTGDGRSSNTTKTIYKNLFCFYCNNLDAGPMLGLEMQGNIRVRLTHFHTKIDHESTIRLEDFALGRSKSVVRTNRGRNESLHFYVTAEVVPKTSRGTWTRLACRLRPRLADQDGVIYLEEEETKDTDGSTDGFPPAATDDRRGVYFKGVIHDDYRKSNTKTNNDDDDDDDDAGGDDDDDDDINTKNTNCSSGHGCWTIRTSCYVESCPFSFVNDTCVQLARLLLRMPPTGRDRLSDELLASFLHRWKRFLSEHILKTAIVDAVHFDRLSELNVDGNLLQFRYDFYVSFYSEIWVDIKSRTMVRKMAQNQGVWDMVQRSDYPFQPGQEHACLNFEWVLSKSYQDCCLLDGVLFFNGSSHDMSSQSPSTFKDYSYVYLISIIFFTVDIA